MTIPDTTDKATKLTKLALFDAAIKSIRESIINNSASVSVTSSASYMNNSTNYIIEATNVPNDWEKKIGIEQDAGIDHVEKLADELGNLIQDFIPDLEDDSLTELCNRIALYAYNNVGSFTSEAIEEYIKYEYQRTQKQMDKQRQDKLDDFKKRKYPQDWHEAKTYMHSNKETIQK